MRWSFLLLGLFILIPTHLLAAEVWLPHYTRADGGFVTDLELINTDFSQTHTVSLQPYTDVGLPLTSAAVTLQVQPGHRLSMDRIDLQWNGQPVAHLLIDAPAAVRISAAYRANRPGALVAPVPLPSGPATQVRFVPQVDPIWFDGLTAVNPSDQPAQLVLSAHDGQGNTLRSAQIEIGPKAKWIGVPRTLLDELPAADGFIRASADTPLWFLGLRGGVGSNSGVLTQLPVDAYEAPSAELTYTNQISRIIQRKCTACHHDGGVAPFPLETYAQVHPLRGWMHGAVEDGIMPPWQPSEDCNSFQEDISLDPIEKEFLLDWLAGPGREGEPARAPELQTWPVETWALGEPDQVLAYTEDYLFDSGHDVYRCYPLPLGNTEEKQVAAIQILPGNPEIVHHVIVFASENTRSQDLDAQEPGPGYTCFGGSGTDDFRVIATWTPGSNPLVLPDTVGMTLDPQTTLIMQVHYHHGSSGDTDRTQVGLYFSQTPRDDEFVLLPLVNTDFVIPPNEANYPVEKAYTVPFGVSAQLYAVLPHMHLLGKSISVEKTSLLGASTCLIDIPNWDYNWQRFYFLEQPIQIQGGDTLHLTCLFDNSEDNPNNPYQPPQPVGWGEATTDEMALAGLGLVLPFDIFKSPAWQHFAQQFNVNHKNRHPDLPPPDMLTPFLKTKAPSCCSSRGTRPWCPSDPQGEP